MAKKKPLYLRTFRKMKRDVRKLSTELEEVKTKESTPKTTTQRWSWNCILTSAVVPSSSVSASF